MKIHKKSESALAPRFALLALIAALSASTALLHARDDESPAKKSARELAEKIREDLKDNENALQDLIRRATENGGQLQLDVDEFEKLMQPREQNGEAEKSTRQEMAEFFERMRSYRERKRPEGGGDVEAGKNEREHRSVLQEYRPVIAQARKSTVGLVAGNKQVALGTVVDSAGYVITKASEVKGKDLRCMLPDGEGVGAKVLDVYAPLDLALVKVDADKLEAVRWADQKGSEIDLGSFLASPGVGEDPIAIGVASVAPRSLSEETKGYLGVAPVSSDGGVRIAKVLPGTPAAKAGLKEGDIVIEIDDTKLSSRAEFHRLVAGRSPGEEVRFKITRGKYEKTLTAKLASRAQFAQQSGRSNPRIDRMNSMGGKLSENRGGYPSAMQTDLTLGPEECGGPVVNLDGEVVGVNIARGGRVKSYAVPASDLKALLGDVKSGKFTVTDLAVLKGAARVAEANLKKAEAALETARKAKQAADRALKEASEK